MSEQEESVGASGELEERSPYSPFAGAYRVLSIRLSDDVRVQLDVLAQLNDRKVTEEVRVALEFWVEKSKSDPEVLRRAEVVRDEIEREAEAKRNAVAAVLGQPSTGMPTKQPSRAAH